MRRLIQSMLLVGVTTIHTGLVSGQEYPNRPIRIITTPPGANLDFAARLIAPGISGPLGQPVVVDNRGGLVTAIEVVAKAPPDGYTLLIGGTAMWLGPLMQKMSYDPVKDFVVVTVIGITPNILVVHPSVPTRSVKELIALAKAKPGMLNYATSATGSAGHLAAELFKSMADIKMERIGYKAGGIAVNDLVAGQVQLSFASGGVTQFIKSGRLRALAVTSAEPSALAPGLPTVAATLPGYKSVAARALFAPAKTSETIINRLNRETVRVLNEPEVKKRFLDEGTEVIGNSPQEAAVMIKSEMTMMDKVIKDAGIHLE